MFVSHEKDIKLLVALLVHGTAQQMQKACEVIESQGIKKIHETVRQGGVQPLVTILETGTETLKTKAASALTNLSRSGKACHEMASKDSGAIALLVTLLRVGTEALQKNAAAALASVDSRYRLRGNKMREKVINHLVQLQKTGTDEQQRYASGALKSFARNDEIRWRGRGFKILHSENGTGDDLPKSEKSLEAFSENATSPGVQPPKDGCCTIL
ncbi:hypothetical protein PR003_g29237 [Phytophthora rubi]|nr:hypothetical protein PR003_g29237 [Phytophthora rubi]